MNTYLQWHEETLRLTIDADTNTAKQHDMMKQFTFSRYQELIESPNNVLGTNKGESTWFAYLVQKFKKKMLFVCKFYGLVCPDEEGKPACIQDERNIKLSAILTDKINENSYCV